MIKANNHSYGLLNAQYRHVLKKCFFLNMLAGMVFYSLPVKALNTIANASANNVADASVSESLNSLKQHMGLVVGQDKAVGYLYVDSKVYNTPLYSEGHSEADSYYGPWIINHNQVYIGYKYENNTKVPVAGGLTLSGLHNTTADDKIYGGSVVVSGLQDNNITTILQVNNVTFSNNSASSSDPGNGRVASGGVIANYGTSDDNFISNSVFDTNYVMSGGIAQGGAVANITATNATGSAFDIGHLVSKNNTYNGNYVGNHTTDRNTLLSQFNGVVAETAQGGAIYNAGEMTSTNDVFTNNYAEGKNALGGAIRNAVENGAGTAISVGNFVLENTSGTINFSGNYAKGSAEAKGGVIANEGTFTSRNSIFSDNYAQTLVDGKAKGGAIYNSLTYNSNSEKYQNNYASGGIVQGGAVYNSQSGNFTISGDSIYLNNKAVSSKTQSNVFDADGGAIYNSGTLNAVSATSLKFMQNQTLGNYARGGAVYNNGKITFTNSLFAANEAIAYTDNSRGGALANTTESDSNAQLSQIIDSSFISNKAISYSTNSQRGGIGGAIYNGAPEGNNKVALLKVIAQNTDVLFKDNVASGASGMSFGGAMANDNFGQLTLETNGKSIIFTGNSATYGGAVSNAASGNNGGALTSVTSYLQISAVNGNIIFQNNKSDKEGGALFNYSDATGAYLHVADGYSLIMSGNTSADGGAISNSASPREPDSFGYLTMQIGDNGTIDLSQNTATGNGGAINNLGQIDIKSLDSAKTSFLNFSENTAEKGGAIFNNKILKGDLKNASAISFNGNVATGGVGGAIYNTTDGKIDIKLSGTSKLVFQTTSDDVYNLGNIKITGDSPNPSTINVVLTGGTLPTSVSSSSTQVVVNSTLGGTGTYEISTTQLNLGSTGYIDYSPVMKLSNNNINLAENSYLNLDTGDVLTNNNFDIAQNATVNYKASDTKPNVDLANTIVNSGLLNLDDNVISDVSIKVLKSENGTILINMDNPSLTADRIIIADKIYGTTNVSVENGNKMLLGADDKIYFAQTQAEQSLDDYKFVSKINNGLYEIAIDYNHKTSADLNDWYFYRTQYLNPEVIAYIDLPRSAIEQSRSLFFNIERLNKGKCDCYLDGYNYICNFKDLGDQNRIWATPVYRSGSFDKPIETDVKMYGVDFGFDHQFNIHSQFGVFGSFRDGTYDNSGKGEGEILSRYGSELDITSILGGAYYRHYFGNLFMNGVVYGGMQSADIKADNEVSASTDGLDIGAQVELGYDIRTSKRSVLTPSIKATYDYIKFDDIKDSAGKEVSFDAVHDIELEAGIKYEYQFNNERQLPTTGYIKPSVVQTIANGGAVKVNDTTFDETLENETLGRIEVGADAELVKNFSVGAFGNYTFGSAYKAWGVGGNVRYNW